MTIVPIVLTVLIPLALLIGVSFIGNNSNIIRQFGPLIKKLPSEYAAYNPAQLIIKIVINYMFPSYFLIIPIMCSGIIGASSFVGEKEHNQQISGLLVLPIILILVGQMTGVLMLSNLVMFIAGIVLLILDYIFIKRISTKFIPEKLI